MENEIREYFRDLKLHKKDIKEVRKKKNMDFLNSLNLTYEVFNKGLQLNFDMGGIKIAFYPTTNKWVCKGKTTFGSAKDLINWMRRLSDYGE